MLKDPNLRNMRAIRERRIIAVPFADVNNGNGRVVDAWRESLRDLRRKNNEIESSPWCK